MLEYLLRLGDNTLVLSQRLSEWCGHGPVLEQDIALTNIALDLLGQTRMYLTYAGELEGAGRSEDDLAYFRDAPQFRNCLLVERPNGDFGQTIVRQFFFDVFNYYQLQEATYHLRFSSEWVIRLGDGTELSKQKMQTAVNLLWPFTGELTTPDLLDTELAEQGVAPNLLKIKDLWDKKVTEVLEEATLTLPTNSWMQSGGKQGKHSEHLGFLLAEMQHLQRTYPGNVW
jgi:ring-1,2-phenylacetyl-CoA epoxidase subunit PaaC